MGKGYDDQFTGYALSTINDNIREKFRNKYINRFWTMGKAKWSRIYKFFCEKGEITESSKLYKLDNVKLKDLITRVSEGVCEHKQVGLPLPINKISKLVGVFNDKRRRMMSMRTYEPDYLVKVFVNTISKELSDMDMSMETRVFPGDWAHSHNNLIDMCTMPDSHYKYSEILEGYFSRAGKELILPDVGEYEPGAILGLSINPKSKPGLLTSMYFGSTRKLSTRYTKQAAYEYCKYILNHDGYILDKSLCEIGGREKRIRVNKDMTKPLKTRTIIMFEDIPTLIQQSIAKPINELLQTLDRGFNYGGRVNGRSNWIKLMDELAPSKGEVNFNADFSGHDNHVCEDAIVAAMAMLRLCFREGEDIDRIFYYAMSSLVFKRVVIPDSNLVYEISKGVPSGHALTSIITTLCSFGTLSTAILQTASPAEFERTRLCMAGDDVIGRLPASLVSRMDNHIKSYSGMVMDDLPDSTGYFNSTSEHSRCTFLKKKFAFMELSWNTPELFINLLYPTMKGKSYARVIDNLWQMIYQAPFDWKLNYTILGLIIARTLFDIEKQEKKYSSKQKNWKSRILQWDKFIDWYKAANYEGIPPGVFMRRINYGKAYLYNSMLEVYTRYDVTHVIHDIIKKYYDEMDKRQRWFVVHRTFKMFETSTRVPIFDMSKRYIRPRMHSRLPYNIYNIYNNII